MTRFANQLLLSVAGSVLLTVIDGSGLAAAPPNSQLLRSIQDDSSPERRAVRFLSREVPIWFPENRCYSCHNNGDAARALYVAHQLGYPIPPESLRETTAWLLTPDRWKMNGGQQEFGDPRLADIQFAFALRSYIESNGINAEVATAALLQASALVVEHQSPDGSWRINTTGAIGSPATYGRYLATAAATRVLQAAGDQDHESALGKAQRWLKRQRPVTVLDAAATILALAPNQDIPLVLRRHCLQVIRRGEAEDGGWGPYVKSGPEPFDTAIVLLALTHLDGRSEVRSMIVRGRRFLIANQLEDGSWLETTRPANGISYAQRLATGGWATLGLLKTLQFGKAKR